MIMYILRRIASAISVIVVTIIASFCLFYLAPTDPAAKSPSPVNASARWNGGT